MVFCGASDAPKQFSTGTQRSDIFLHSQGAWQSTGAALVPKFLARCGQVCGYVWTFVGM